MKKGFTGKLSGLLSPEKIEARSKDSDIEEKAESLNADGYAVNTDKKSKSAPAVVTTKKIAELEAEIEQLHQIIASAQIIEVKIADIDRNTGRKRRPSVDYLKYLKASIESNGIDIPPIVKKAPEGSKYRFEMVAGHYRTETWESLGHDTIRVMFDVNEDGLHADLKGLRTNLNVEAATPFEVWEQVSMIQGKYGSNKTEIARSLGLHENSSILYKIGFFSKLPEETLEIVKDVHQELKIYVLERISSITDPTDPKHLAVLTGALSDLREGKISSGSHLPDAIQARLVEEGAKTKKLAIAPVIVGEYFVDGKKKPVMRAERISHKLIFKFDNDVEIEKLEQQVTEYVKTLLEKN